MPMTVIVGRTNQEVVLSAELKIFYELKKKFLSGGGDERWEKEAPVAPVRKWEADRKAIA